MVCSHNTIKLLLKLEPAVFFKFNNFILDFKENESD